MPRRFFAVKSAVVPAVAAAALVGLTASPALANTVTHGAFACGPDQVVYISYYLSAKATSTVTYEYPLADGNIEEVALNFKAATYVSADTSQRDILNWSVTSSKTVEDASDSCGG